MSPRGHTSTKKAIQIIQCPTSVCGKEKKTISTNTHTKLVNNKINSQDSYHSRQSLAMEILLDKEINMEAAKSKTLLQVDLESFRYYIG